MGVTAVNDHPSHRHGYDPQSLADVASIPTGMLLAFRMKLETRGVVLESAVLRKVFDAADELFNG